MKLAKNILYADSAEVFAQAVVHLIGEPGLAAGLGAAGRKTVGDHYDWRTEDRAWDQIYGC